MAELKRRQSLKETMQPPRAAQANVPPRQVMRPAVPQRVPEREPLQHMRMQQSQPQFQNKNIPPEDRQKSIKTNMYTPRLIAAACFSGLILIALIGMSLRGSSTVVSVEPEAAATLATGQAKIVPTAPQGVVAQSAEQAARLERIMKGLGKHILLPKEVPQVMQITNPDELMKQDQFFNGSQKDDVLVIFQKAGKALIYSESRDIIINVGPVQLDQKKTTGGTSVQN